MTVPRALPRCPGLYLGAPVGPDRLWLAIGASYRATGFPAASGSYGSSSKAAASNNTEPLEDLTVLQAVGLALPETATIRCPRGARLILIVREDLAVCYVGQRFGDLVGVDGGNELGQLPRERRDLSAPEERPQGVGIGEAEHH
jgi:hypothetical protein